LINKNKKNIKRTLGRKILNAFIGLFGFAVFLFILFLGYSQTETFHKYLRNKLIAYYSENFNGKLSVKNITGSLFTSLQINNLKISVGKDDIFYADRIGLRLNPLLIFKKTINLNNIELINGSLNILQDSSGLWNYQLIIKNKSKGNENLTAQEENNSNPFNLKIENLEINNFKFLLKNFKHIQSDSVYASINWDDLNISRINLNATLFINPGKRNYNLILNNFSAQTNTKTFRLKKLSGFFYADSSELLVDNLILISDSSNIELSARLNELNIFNMPALKKFKDLPLNLKLDAKPFNFSDLSTFLPSTNFLTGNVKLGLSADGTFGNINIQKLALNLSGSRLFLKGKLQKLNTPENLYINARIFNSRLNEKDAVSLMPSLNLPEFNNYSFKKVNIIFRGEPTNFFVKFTGEHEKGNLSLKGKLDLNAPSYNIIFLTSNLNLKGILNSPTLLSSAGRIKGRGFNPNKLNTILDITSLNSNINGYQIDSLNLRAEATSKKLKFNLNSIINKSKLEVKGKLDLSNEESPKYNLKGKIDSLNLERFTKNNKLNSNLNFAFEAKGSDLRIDSMNAFFKISLNNSMLQEHYLEDSDLNLALKHWGNKRLIKLSSDFIDLNLTGNFSLQKAIDLLKYQSNTIANIFKHKFNQLRLNPNNSNTTNMAIDSVAFKPIAFTFNYKIKDFEPLAILLNAQEFDIAGSGYGKVNNSQNEFNLSGNFKLDYLMNAKKNSIIYFSNLNTDFHFTRNNNSLMFKDLFGSLSLEGNKIFWENEFKNIAADIVFNQNKLFITTSFNLNNNLATELDGSVLMSGNKQNIAINNFLLSYNNIEWVNDSTLNIDISGDSLIIRKFHLKHSNTIASLKGFLVKDSLNAQFKLSKMSGELLSRYLLNKNVSRQIRAKINIKGNALGTLDNPLITLFTNIDSLGIQDKFFGNLFSEIKLKDGLLISKANFLNLKNDLQHPILTFSGQYPLFKTTRKPDKRIFNFKLVSKNFELEPLSSMIPLVENINGKLNANVSISGTPNNFKYSGFFKLNKIKIKTFPNNLTYLLDANITLSDSTVKINKISIANTNDVPQKGELNSSGKIILRNYQVKNIQITSRGSLAILSQTSRFVSPNFYGDLFLKTDKTLILKKENGKLNLSGKIKIQNANLIVAPTRALTSSTTNITYNFLEDTSKINYEEKKFKRYLTLIKRRKKLSAKELPFDFNLAFEITNDAKLELLLSKIWNQKLVMLVKGNVDYINKNGTTHAQGILKLQNGSRFEFIKTFDASGSIKFESDLANPYLDVTAMYIGNYNRGSANHPDFIDVGVLFKLNGTLDKIGTNLVNNPDNIAIYIGSQNIQNKVRDNRYDFSDALLFIYLGRFKEDLTAKDKSKLAGLSNTATSFLGSAITSIVNSAVGDVVSDIQVNQNGQATQITISGRFENIRYSIGGTTQIQNINEANVKIEYQLLPNLILRLERKNPVIRSFGVENKISELGLKYLWEF